MTGTSGHAVLEGAAMIKEHRVGVTGTKGACASATRSRPQHKGRFQISAAALQLGLGRDEGSFSGAVAGSCPSVPFGSHLRRPAARRPAPVKTTTFSRRGRARSLRVPPSSRYRSCWGVALGVS
jgi:ATP-dependent helicase YprA (DUF1998 family)